jgi:hypothetical protein
MTCRLVHSCAERARRPARGQQIGEQNLLLAYVFWHWKQPQVSAIEYESRQRAFHAALAAAPPEGFHKSFSVALAQAPWNAASGEVYEDWYLVQDFTALGILNEAAVSAGRAMPHDAAAAFAAGGTAGLYRLRLGTALPNPQYAHWFSKPGGMSYDKLLKRFAPRVEQSQGVLWIRQMTFGPALEFCLHTSAPRALPAPFTVNVTSLRSVWP